MNRWLSRAVGTVGLASGALLVGTGTAHADEAAGATEAGALSTAHVERVGDRPVVGDDPMFAEPHFGQQALTQPRDTRSTGALSDLPLAGGLATDLPLLGGLGLLNTLGELDVLDTLAGPITLVRALPVGDTAGNLLPGAH